MTRWLVFLGLIVSGCDRPAEVDQPFLIGVCHVFSQEDVEKARELGCHSVRLGFHWDTVERMPGSFSIPQKNRAVLEAARVRSMTVQAVMGYGNPHYDAGRYPESPDSVEAFGRFAAFVVRQTKRQPTLPEIWNEWNLGVNMPTEAGKGSPEAYVPVLRQAYNAIKAASPDSFVLGGCMAGAGLTNDWTKRACQAGLLDYLDALSFHPYSFWETGVARSPEFGAMRLVEKVEQTIADFPRGNDVPFYLTEIGWNTHPDEYGVSLDEQAQFAARILFLARANPRIKGLWWFNLNDRNSRSGSFHDHFGLYFSDGSPKPAAFAFQDAARFIRQLESADEVDVRRGVRVIKCRMTNGERALVLWAVRSGEIWKFTVDGHQGLSSTLLAGTGRWIPWKVKPGQPGEVTVGNMPLILRNVAPEAKILRARRIQSTSFPYDMR